MSKQGFMPIAPWVSPEERQEFAVRLAAIYHNRSGSIGDLSLALGGSRTLLHMALKQNGLNADHCIKLEAVLGRDLFPREFFRPDIFIPTAE